MIYKFNEKVPVEALADLRESVGWEYICDLRSAGILIKIKL